MPSAADALTFARLAAAAAMPGALARGGLAPVALWVVAVATDFADGRVARRAGGGSGHGAVLDPLADVAFMLATFLTLAGLGRVPWLVPMAIVASVSAYAVATVRASRADGGVQMARSRIGHAAGVVNWAAAGVAVAAGAWPGSLATAAVPLATGAVVLVNVAAVAERSIRGQLARRPT